MNWGQKEQFNSINKNEKTLTEILNEVDTNWKLYDTLAMQWYDHEEIKKELLNLYNE